MSMGFWVCRVFRGFAVLISDHRHFQKEMPNFVFCCFPRKVPENKQLSEFLSLEDAGSSNKCVGIEGVLALVLTAPTHKVLKFL